MEHSEKCKCGKPRRKNQRKCRECHAENMRKFRAEKKARLETLEQLLKMAKCPHCDGSGAYYDDCGDICQCQWCDERDQLFPSGKELKQAELKVGDKVHYHPGHYSEQEWTNGVVKEIPENSAEFVRVVYHCGGDWVRFSEYTGALTHIDHLKRGWK